MMSSSKSASDNSVIRKLTNIESRKLGVPELAGLPGERVAALKLRLIAEKDTILGEFEKTGSIRAASGRPKRLYWLYGAVAAILLIALAIPLTQRSVHPPGVTVSYSQGEVKISDRPVIAGSKLMAGNTITAANTSLTAFKYGSQISAVLAQNSRVTLNTPKEMAVLPHLELEKLQGLVFCKVQKGQATLKVRTPVADITVIGTSFSVDSSELATTVDVLEGIVQVVVSDSSSTVRQVAAGQKIQVMTRTREILSRPLNMAELHALRNFQELSTSAMPGAELSQPDPELAQLAEQVSKNDSVLRAQSGPVRLTLAEIRKKYGKISRVRLTNGVSHVGFFTLKGEQMQIITPNGTVKLPSAMLKDVSNAE